MLILVLSMDIHCVYACGARLLYHLIRMTGFRLSKMLCLLPKRIMFKYYDNNMVEVARMDITIKCDTPRLICYYLLDFKAVVPIASSYLNPAGFIT